LPIENGADINAKDIRDETPLHWAALFGSVEMAALTT
jgi:ankyrin repeat protein